MVTTVPADESSRRPVLNRHHIQEDLQQNQVPVVLDRECTTSGAILQTYPASIIPGNQETCHKIEKAVSGIKSGVRAVHSSTSLSEALSTFTLQQKCCGFPCCPIWRDYINFAEPVVLACGAVGLYLYRGFDPHENKFTVLGVSCLILYGAVRSYFSCGEESVFVVTNAFLLGYFLAHFLHYKGNLWYPELFVVVVTGATVWRVILKSFELWPEDF